MIAPPIELSPARPAFAVVGWVGLASDIGGVLVALVCVRPPVAILALLVANVVLSAAVSLAMGRRGLRRVLASIPRGAVVVPFRFPTARLLGSVLTTVTVSVLAIVGVVTPAVLGAGLGAEIGLLWSTRKIGEFERDDGRRVLRATRRRRGQPALYAHPAF